MHVVCMYNGTKANTHVADINRQVKGADETHGRNHGNGVFSMRSADFSQDIIGLLEPGIRKDDGEESVCISIGTFRSVPERMRWS
jgi:hypothetical protein